MPNHGQPRFILPVIAEMIENTHQTWLSEANVVTVVIDGIIEY